MKLTGIDYSVLGVILALAVNITILLIEFAIGNINVFIYMFNNNCYFY